MQSDIKKAKRISQIIGCLLLLLMLAVSLFSFFTGIFQKISVLSLLIKIFFKFLIFALPLLLAGVVLRHENIEIPKTEKQGSKKKAAIIVISSFGTIVLLECFYSAVFPEALPIIGISRGNSFFENILIGLLFTALPALMEELFFRGLILRSLCVFRTSLAVLISALAFALMHFSVNFFPLAFIFGLMIGTAYVSTGSVLSVILIHFLCNAFWVVSETVAIFWGDFYSTWIRGAITVCVLLSSVGLAALKDSLRVLFADDDQMSVPSSCVWSVPMIIFVVLAVWIQFFIL